MLQRIKKMKGIPNHKMWLVYSHVGVFTWIASTFFHMFDCDVTERLDYFGAFSFVLAALYVSMIFIFPELAENRGGQVVRLIMTLVFLFLHLSHARDMYNNFNYGYNMGMCVCMSILTTLAYIFYLYRRRSHLGSFQEVDILLIRLIVWANLATALELLDFAPVFWIFDAHSLFHLATVPIPLWWADLLEVHYDLKEEQKDSILKMA